MSYAYAPLDASKDEFRLVKLWPGSFEDEIQISIFHAPLRASEQTPLSKRLGLKELKGTLPSDWNVRETIEGRYVFISPSRRWNTWRHPDETINCDLYSGEPESVCNTSPYEALSYVWGPPEPSEHVWVRPDHGQRDSRASLRIGPSLAGAMRHFRQRHNPRILWIDMLCINQSDLTERSAQVKRMVQIYPLASRVLIWLGDESIDSKHAIETLTYFSRQVVFFKDNWRGHAPGAVQRHWIFTSVVPSYSATTWSALEAFFSRPWFSRIWVLQEARLANNKATMHCGQDEIPWSAIRKSILVMGIKPSMPTQLYAKLSSLRLGFFHSTSYLDLARWTSFQLCTDPRDKVFGTLGLCSPDFNKSMKPDYTMDVLDVYQAVAKTFIEVSDNLSILRMCRISNAMIGLPSWVPNLGGSESPRSQGSQFASGYSAAQGAQDAYGVLRAYGKSCAVVTLVDDFARGTISDILATVRQWQSKILDGAAQYTDALSYYDAFVRLITKGHLKERWGMVNYISLNEFQNFLNEHNSGCDRIDPLRGRVVDLDGFCFFMTQEGHIGLTNAEVRPGDQVYALLGCSYSILLRCASAGSFQVVGPCIAQGLMDGEGILGRVPRPWEVTVAPNTLGIFEQVFRSLDTGEMTKEDPRLPPLPPSWKYMDLEHRLHDQIHPHVFENLDTGEILKSDPRMSPEALKERGIQLETVRLI